jgi:hypothetical protein
MTLSVAEAMSDESRLACFDSRTLRASYPSLRWLSIAYNAKLRPLEPRHALVTLPIRHRHASISVATTVQKRGYLKISQSLATDGLLHSTERHRLLIFGDTNEFQLWMA